jgi:hypothetical protein
MFIVVAVTHVYVGLLQTGTPFLDNSVTSANTLIEAVVKISAAAASIEFFILNS